MQLEPLECLLVSQSTRSNGKWRSATFILIAVYLFVTAGWMFFNTGFSQKALINFLMGFCSVIVVGYEKRIYVSPKGFVKETHTWFSHHRDLLPWEKTKFVTIFLKNGRVMALIEPKDEPLGWKIAFGEADYSKLKGIVREYGPKVELNDMGNRAF